LRAKLKAVDVRASGNDCVLYAVARALARSPKVNATYDAAEGVGKTSASVDVAVAVATDGGEKRDSDSRPYDPVRASMVVS